MAVGDLYRISFQYGVDGQTNVNVMYMRQEESVNAADNAQTAAQTVGTQLGIIYGSVLPIAVRTPRGCIAQLISRINSDVGEFNYEFGGGAPAGDALPSVIAAVQRLRTGLAGRTRRGRVYVGGVPAAWESNGLLNANGNDAYALWSLAMREQFCGGAPLSKFRLGVFSRTRYAILSSPFDEYWAPVTTISSVDSVATQRRRRVGIGS